MTLPSIDNCLMSYTGAFIPILAVDKEFIISTLTSPLNSDYVSIVPIRISITLHVLVLLLTILYVGLPRRHSTFWCYNICTEYLSTTELYLIWENVKFCFSWLKHIGHNIISQGNTTAKSKCRLVINWSLPTTVNKFHLFVSLCNYYSKFSQFF